MLPFFSSLSTLGIYPLSFSPAFTLFFLSHHNPAHHYVRIYSLTQVAEETPRSQGQDTKPCSNIVSQGKGQEHPIPPTPAPSPKCVISTTSLHTFLAWPSSLLISPSVFVLSISLCASLINYFALSFPAQTHPLYPDLSSVLPASSLPPPAAQMVKHHFDLCLHVHKASFCVSVSFIHLL